MKTELFKHPHTGARIKENIKNTLLEFGLQDKTVTAVTDNGSYVISGLRLAKIDRLPCTAHSLHLFLSKDIFKKSPTLDTIVTKLKPIYRTLTYKYDDLIKYAETHA